ncbi:MAG TPA: T9SS type A sorting domain-containing protein, partial [Saprospiraceae bacterium]|nr:T9SS type A sorting domain-containing protein [Saprospiraceae bacterium]
DGSFTTAKGPGNTATYALFTGTSAATPHVTGAVGLLYSLDCPTLASDALSNPAACALRFKELLLKSAKPNASLQGKTVTGGRLDVGAAVDSVRADCGGSSGPLQISLIRPNPVHNLLEVHYETPNFEPYTFRVFNMLGQLVFEDKIVPEQYGEKVYFWEDVYNLPAGVYIASFHQGRARVAKKFVKI